MNEPLILPFRPPPHRRFRSFASAVVLLVVSEADKDPARQASASYRARYDDERILRVVARIETDGWSMCPCGEEHGQSEAAAKVPGVMRGDAELMRKVRTKGTG
ncbi:hypothetical protein ACWEKU_12505 [Streptomyces californicus]